MHENDIKLLEESFKKYYFDHFDLIHVPDKPSLREFGYQKFNTGMIRHLSVKDDKELRLLLIQNIPSNVYCSNGYYSFPSMPMSDKDWQEADLIFDIDAKDLKLPCRIDHTFHKCGSCGKIFQKNTVCPQCNSSKYESKSLPCTICINATKKEIEKLLQILIEDFGIDRKSIYVYFSGNEGFHVYVYDTPFQKLGSRERIELVDYIMFKSAIPKTFGIKGYKTRDLDLPTPNEKGWSGRVAKKLFGSKPKRSKLIAEIKKNGTQIFANKLEQISPIIGVNIDPNVTTDIHRIFRLPGSLNSKSGMAKILCKNIDKFNPYNDACFIDESKIQVIADFSSVFKLKNKKFGPYNEESISVPKFAAVYMICKGLATLA